MANTAIAYQSVFPSPDWRRFGHVDTWIFDLDDTLYPRSSGLHEQMKSRVVSFVSDLMKTSAAEAEALHLEYYERYGATLQGLMQLHAVAPDAFLDFVHAIDLTVLSPDLVLSTALESLPGRRIVFTNGPRRHAASVLQAMQIGHLFEAVYCIEDCGFIGKPQRSAYASVLEAHAINPLTAAIFDDRVGNLKVPYELGIRTVLISPMASRHGHYDHVDAVTDNIGSFLDDLIQCPRP